MPGMSRATAVGVGDARITLAPVPFRSNRTMLVSDKRFAVGELVYEIPNNRFVSHAGGGLWIPLGGAAGPLNTLTGDVGAPVVPLAGNINIQGGAVNSAISFSNGGAGQMDAAVIVDGTTIGINAFNQLQMFGTVTGSGSTVGAVTADVITFPLGATPGIWTFVGMVSGFEGTTPMGGSYEIIAGARTDGVTATIVGVPDTTDNEDAAFVTADLDIVASGNNAVIRVTGIVGFTIDWTANMRSQFAP